MGKSKSESVSPFRLEDKWDTPELFQTYDIERALFRPTTRRVVNAVLQQYLLPEGINIEVGSGMGELVNNLITDQALRDSIVQTEQGQAIIDARGQEGVQRLNVYKIRQAYPAGSVDTFIGLASFDTLSDLDLAIQNMAFALKSGGRIIHFLDMSPSPNTFLNNFRPDKDKRTPFPWLDQFDTISGFVLVDRSRIAHAAATTTLTPIQKSALKRYVRNPEAEYVDLEYQRALKSFAAFARRLVDQTGSEVVSIYDYFYDRLRLALQRGGFEIEVFEGREQAEILDIRSVDDPMGMLGIGRNFAKNNVGDVTQGYDAELAKSIPPLSAQVSSVVHVVVARK